MHTLTIGTRLGDYTIVRLIARGGMGEVYEALDMRLDRRIALKVIAHDLQDREGNDLIRRFLQEARLLAKVNHPNVVTVHSIDSMNGTQFIAMEYVEGVALREFLRVQAFPVEVAVLLFEQMLNGLKCLHDNKIVHRDLKPGNVLVRADGQIKILDFGIASSLDRRGHTDPGLVVGTPNYMAPELRQGAPATPRSDFWALGALFYECLIGRPFAQAVKNSRGSPFNSEHGFIPVELRSLITCMTAPAPEERYESAEQILSELRKLRRAVPAPSETVWRAITRQIQALIDQARPKTGSAQEPVVKSSETTVMVARMKEPAPSPAAASSPPRAGPAAQRMPPPLPLRSRRGKSNVSYPLVGGVAAALLLAFVLADLTKESPPRQQGGTNSEAAAPISTPVPMPVSSGASKPLLGLLEPVDGQRIWLEPSKNPMFVWSRGVNAGEFKIQIATDESFRKLLLEDGVKNNWYLPAIDLPEGRYYWRLVASADSAGGEMLARSFSVSRATAVRLLRPERDREARALEPLEVEWTCKPTVDHYVMQVSSEPEFSRPRWEERVSSCKWRLPGAPAGRYFWRVGVENPVDRRMIWSPESAFTLTSPPISATVPERRKSRNDRSSDVAAPVLVNPELVRTLSELPRERGAQAPSFEAQIELAWRPVRGAREYVVRVSRVRDFSDIIGEVTSRGEKIVWRANSPGIVYWRVSARGSAGQLGRPSATGQVRLSAPLHRGLAAKSPAPKLAPPPPAKAPLSAPTPHSPENAASAPSKNGRISIEFSWAAIAAADTYTLELSDDANFDRVIKSVTVPASKVLLERLELKGRIYWRVRANGSGQRSAWSKPTYLDIL